MSSGIRRKTRRAFVCLVALVLLSSCHESSHLNQPSTLPVPSAIPYFLTAGASVGLGNDAGRATISVKVQNVEGGPMQDVPVKFETDQGTIDPANAMTLADGTARALLTASVTATVMISTRTLSQRLLVTAQAPPGAPPVTPTPPPVPPSPGTTPLTVAMAAAPAPSGSETNFSFSTNGAVVQEVWTFGDGTPPVTTTTHHAAHVYASPGAYPTGVTVLDTLGRTAASTLTVTIDAPPTPPPPPGPSYAVTLVVSPTTVIIGTNPTLTATAIPQNGAPAANSYAFDCENDGTPEATGALNTTTTCLYPMAGTLTAAVRVTGGTATGGATTVVTVTAPPLFVNIVATLIPIKINVATSFTATITTAGPMPTTLQWAWDFDGNGVADLVVSGTPSSNMQAYTYVSTATTQIKVTVTDTSTGRTAIGVLPITIAP